MICPPSSPIQQKRIWDRFEAGRGPGGAGRSASSDCEQEDGRFHVEGGSWTNNISWVRGYDDVLGPMEPASALFAQKVLEAGRRHLRPALPQRPVPPAADADELLSLLGPGPLDRLRPGTVPPDHGDSDARSVRLLRKSQSRAAGPHAVWRRAPWGPVLGLPGLL